jgi:hypothetical protein
VIHTNHLLPRLISVAMVFSLFGAASAGAAKITVEPSANGAKVSIDNEFFTEYVKLSGTKPILWPIIGPTGKPVTRCYPMAEGPAKETKDHPHHRSLWFTHASVNRVNFWDENRGHGMVKHREFVKMESGDQGTLVARSDWVALDGKKGGDRKICEDEVRLTFGADGSSRWIDYDITIKATEGPITFGDTKEGSFGMRVAESMKVDAKKTDPNLGGKIVNSVGQTDDKAWGKKATWVDYHGPVDGQTVGIAVMNHPTSFRFPTYWHVRTYGLFAANPFGWHDFPGGEKLNGAYSMPKDASVTFRYRILLHKGNEQEGRVAEAYEEYAKTAK